MEGNLIGEYSHREPGCTRSYGEAASREDNGNDWQGVYRSCWVEPPHFESHVARLTIMRKLESANLFKLEWRDPANSNLLFIGEAMLSDDLLIGDYTGV